MRRRCKKIRREDADCKSMKATRVPNQRPIIGSGHIMFHTSYDYPRPLNLHHACVRNKRTPRAGCRRRDAANVSPTPSLQDFREIWWLRASCVMEVLCEQSHVTAVKRQGQVPPLRLYTRRLPAKGEERGAMSEVR